MMEGRAGLFPDPEREPLAAGFAEFIQRLAGRLGASPEAARLTGEAAGACIRALAEGDVCADLSALAGALGRPEEELRRLLFSSGVFAAERGGAKLPLVLDGGGRIYLWRYFDYERQLAEALVARIPLIPLRPPDPAVRAWVEGRFRENEARLSGRPDGQKIAVFLALANPLTVISGGPGTGKTTIVTTLIAALAMQDSPPRMALAAPTGKAAARMEDALRRQMDALNSALRERLPARASTLHRLLGAKPESGEFLHGRDNPLPFDLVVVDEASMMDLSLASRLFAAMPPGSRVVLLGDKDQLAAVEAGAVFAELARRELLPDCVVWLKENYRFGPESAIGRLAERVGNGDALRLAEWLEEQGGDAVRWRAVGEGLPARVVDELVLGYEPYLAAVLEGDPQAALSAFETFGVLCAVRRGNRGVAGVNEALARRLRPRLDGGAADAAAWYHGRPVMVTANDYNLGLFNGDIGIALGGGEGERRVWFAAREGGVRSVPPSALPAHETAFAMTVHKSQGSEFESVALVLPERDSPVLTRELIYTAVTRAKRRLTLYGSPDMLRTAANRPTERRGGLAERIDSARAKGI